MRSPPPPPTGAASKVQSPTDLVCVAEATIETETRTSIHPHPYPSLLAASIVALYGSMLIVLLVFGARRYEEVYEYLGMTGDDLPVPTQLMVGFLALFSSAWMLAGIAFLGLAVLAWRGVFGRKGWRAPVLVAAAALLFPFFAYLALEMPIIKLREKLGEPTSSSKSPRGGQGGGPVWLKA